jgi:hypothetical protein
VTVSARLPPLLLLALLPRLLAAQGMTTAAIQGTVRGDVGSPIVAATVRVTNLSNGHGWQVVTPSTGRFLFETVEIGGPYRIEVRAIGFAPEARSGIVLALGERLIADFGLRPAPMQLPEVTVTATGDPVLNPGRTGPGEVIPAATILGLPNPRRDFVTLTLLSPQVSDLSFGGQNRLYNSFQIDGGVNQDLYLGRLPGRDALPRPISLEAIQEIQVLAAPFDVRQGGFAGGLVNAVTKSGTNTLHGSLFGFVTGGALVGKGPAGNPLHFTTGQYGGTIGGPIVRGRAHYFLSVDLQHRVSPDAGPFITDTAGGADTARTGISYASALRFQDILRNTYGLDPGTPGPVDEAVPARDVLGKITVQLGTNNHLEASHHHARGDLREGTPRDYGFYSLSSRNTRQPSSLDASRLIWTRVFGGRWSNELMVSYLHQRDECRPVVTYPIISVSADQGILDAGLGCLGLNEVVDQRSAEITDHATVALGGHIIGFGGQGTLLRFQDPLVGVGAGLWRFDSLDSLQNGQAWFYRRGLLSAGGTPGVEFRVHELGIYLQDRWTPTPGLTLTMGLRLDVPLLPDAIPTNDSLQAALGADTGRLPSGNALWSPRLGINYDLGGLGRTFLRGGIGLFGGPPPYRWVGNAYRDHGEQLNLLCVGPAVPPFDPVNQPATCGAGPRPRFSFFDPGVRFPQNLKAALGVDQRLPGGVVATIDLLYTRAVHQLYLNDANLLPPTGVAPGEGDRPLYGSIDADGTPAPGRRDPSLPQVARVSSRSGDDALSFSAQLHKRLGGLEGSVLYAYTRARDRMSFETIGLPAGLTGTPLDGTLEDRRVRTSLFETRHRVLLQAAARLPYGMRLALLYEGASGTPFTYVINGDANADGIGVDVPNDIVYVPRNAVPGGDISLLVEDGQGTLVPAPASEYARLDAFIQGEPCLREQRGRILARNSCRNPWFGILNARLTKAIPTAAGHSLELTVDVYNVLNLISARWGLSRATSDVTANLLSLVRYDATAGRGVYELALPARNQIRELESRWQLEFSVRYGF